MNAAPSQPESGRVADAPQSNWIDRRAPDAIKPYLRLARWDRPIGTWLLLWPGWWALALAAVADPAQAFADPVLVLLFGIGAIAMRGAGCTYNDLVDQDFDSQVERTRSRPLPSGQVTRRQAKLFMIGQALVGLLVLLTFNNLAIVVGVLSILLIVSYPFMKRITYWPQAWLGLTFNWGALLGWAAAQGNLAWPAFVLYAAGFFWTLGYDTIYAHQDKEDDILIGVKSSALKLGQATKKWMVIFYTLTILLLGLAGYLVGAGVLFYAGLIAAALHLGWQIKTLDIDDSGNCLRLFKSNRDFGTLVFISLCLGLL